MPDAKTVQARFTFDATGFMRAVDQAAAAMAKLELGIRAAGRALGRMGRDLKDAQFIHDGGRFYWQIVTGSDGVTREVRRRDFTGWRR